MSEAIWVNINFRTPPGWEKWVESIRLEYFEWDTPDNATWQIMGEGNYGLLDGDIENLLETLREYRVPYIATQDAKYEITGEIVVFDGTHTWVGEWSESGPVLSNYAYQQIVSGKAEVADPEDYFATLNVGIDELSIDHLQAWPPPDPDEALSFDEVEGAGLDGTLMQIGES